MQIAQSNFFIRLYKFVLKSSRQNNYGVLFTAQFTAHALLEYYFVRLSKNQHPYVSMRTDYLYTLPKNLTAQSAHLNYAVLPKVTNHNTLRSRFL